MRRTGLVIVLGLTIAAPAFAQGAASLTATDFRYLKTLGETPSDLKAMHPTPAMLERLHALINDPATEHQPKARADAVGRFVDHINAQYVWCQDHPAEADCGGAKSASSQ